MGDTRNPDERWYFVHARFRLVGHTQAGKRRHMQPTIFSQLTLHQVDTLISTPSILSKYQRQSYTNIKHIAVGGEPCPQA